MASIVPALAEGVAFGIPMLLVASVLFALGLAIFPFGRRRLG